MNTLIKRCVLGILLCFSAEGVLAQTQTTIQNDTISKIEQQSDKIFDNSQQTPPTYVRKEGIYTLKDHPKAESYDKKWLKELSNSDLFFQMSDAIQNEGTTDVVYDELPTEVLKQRLEKLNQKTHRQLRRHGRLLPNHPFQTDWFWPHGAPILRQNSLLVILILLKVGWPVRGFVGGPN